MARETNTFVDDNSTRGNRGEFRVKSAGRVVEVLDLFRRLKRPSRANEVSEILGLAPSSTSDLLQTLVEAGYLDFDRKMKTYFPGIRATLFAQWLASEHPAREQIPKLELFANTLRDKCGENVVLFAHRQHQVQVISVAHSDIPPPRNIFEGASLPVFGTAAGGAVLMDKSRGELGEIARQTYRTRACGKVADSMGEIVGRFRCRGYASPIRDDIIPDNWAIALPLPVTAGQGSIVVGLGGPIARVRKHERELAELARITIFSSFGEHPAAHR